MKLLIGVVGGNGAGKDTFTAFLTATAAPLTVSRVRFSDVLYDTLRLWGIPPTRSNLQNMAIIMDCQYGKGSLTRATEDRIKKQKADIVVVEGVRWKTDVSMLSSFKNFTLVYITAKPEIRFGRMKKRAEKSDEAKKTYKEFLREEAAATEVDIPEIGSKADLKIENNGTLAEFRQEIERFYKNLILI